MLTEVDRYLQSAPLLAIFPGVAIVLSVLGFNLIGDGLREALDPKLRGRVLSRSSRSRTCASSSGPRAAPCTPSTASRSTIAPGETLGLVGESGCGKSVTSLALLGILAARTAASTAARARVRGPRPDRALRLASCARSAAARSR